MANKITFKVINNKFEDFINKLSDLTNIDDTIKLKIDNDNILMYSTLGGSVMLAFKNYLLNTKDYLLFDDDLDKTYDIVIPNSSKFVKNLEFLKNQSKITLSFSYKESNSDENTMNARDLNINGGDLKVKWLAGESHNIRDINKNILESKLDINNRNWYFSIKRGQFLDIKKLSNINSQRIININVEGGVVYLSETSAWEMKIGEIEKPTASFVFNKRFLKCINSDIEEIEFNMFDTFILVKEGNSNLMLSYEQDFSDDNI